MATKKTLKITGTPLYPITVGNAAVINETGTVRKTSAVICVDKVSDNDINFETQNTLYQLHIPANSFIAGEMIKLMFRKAGH